MIKIKIIDEKKVRKILEDLPEDIVEVRYFNKNDAGISIQSLLYDKEKGRRRFYPSIEKPKVDHETPTLRIKKENGEEEEIDVSLPASEPEGECPECHFFRPKEEVRCTNWSVPVVRRGDSQRCYGFSSEKKWPKMVINLNEEEVYDRYTKRIQGMLQQTLDMKYSFHDLARSVGAKFIEEKRVLTKVVRDLKDRGEKKFRFK